MDIIIGNVWMIIRIGEAVLYKAFEFYTSIYHHEFFLLSFIHLFITMSSFSLLPVCQNGSQCIF